MKSQNIHNNQAGLGKPWLIAIIVAGVLLAGAVGYVLGGNAKESDLKAQYEQQVQSLQKDLDSARDVAGEELEDTQDSIEQGQQTLESLQAENTQLKTTIEEQKVKIADLENQLEEANSETPPTQN